MRRRAQPACDALRTRGVRLVTTACRLASTEAGAAQCALPLSRVCMLAAARDWAVDDGGRVSPTLGGAGQAHPCGVGMELVRDLETQRVHVQTG